MTEGSKYHPLFEFLLFCGQGEKTLTFAEIEALIGARLPPSARRREEWWSNNASGHSQARAWLRANYKAGGVDLARETITFRLDGWPDGYSKIKWPPVARDDAAVGFDETGQKEYASKSHPLFGIWAGKVTLLPDTDYTKPAFDMDDAS